MRAVYRDAEILSKREDPALGLGELAGGELEIFDIPSGHTSMLLEPDVQTVAEKIRPLLLRLRETIALHRKSAA